MSPTLPPLNPSSASFRSTKPALLPDHTLPQRGKLANQESAARSRQRRAQYKSDLEDQVVTLKTETNTLQNMYNQLQNAHTVMGNEFRDLSIRHEGAVKQVHLHQGDDADLEEFMGNEGDSTTWRSAICFDAPRDCFFLPCGHCVSCYQCGTKIAEASGSCPICRRKLKKVKRIFRM
ncbi:hypothetical protein AALP_AAs66306U000100 [Arabis alpina]|uniref:RING-type E3 ubiquitin transferase n=1 Tax=Arabis alpina TaxID=50452 RepID=A0A087FY30_ARAAL|nr:hypothetical protein AALP_AAs66306U000100 [Arabis alpina]